MTNTKSIYSMLARSEEDEASRNVFEAAAYGLVLLSAIIVMWQAALQGAALPKYETAAEIKLAQKATAQQIG